MYTVKTMQRYFTFDYSISLPEECQTDTTLFISFVSLFCCIYLWLQF